MEGREMSLPDATKAQVAAVVQAVVATAVAFGVPISDQQSVALIALAGVIGTVLMTADAAIRRERARNADKLRPHATLTTTSTSEEGTQSVAKVAVPFQEGASGADVNAQLVDLLRGFQTLARLLEAEREREEAGGRNGARRRQAAARGAQRTKGIRS
jgi:hypothetical protein